jgi:hypothetical protein
MVVAIPARASVVEEFRAEDWSGMAFTNDETGAFSHCVVYAEYQNGATLYISYEVTESWFVSVTHNDWSLTEGVQYAISVEVDRRGETDGTAVALGPHQLGLSIAGDDPFIRQIRRGNLLTFTFRSIEYGFELSNSNRALNAAQDCVRRHLAAGTRTPIVRPGTPAAPAGESESALEAGASTGETGSGEADTALAPAPARDLPPFGSDVIEELTVPGWQAAALAEGAAFTHCAIKAEYENGTTLGFGRTVEGFFLMALRRADWTLTPGEWRTVKYGLGAQQPLDAAEGKVIDQGLIVVDLGQEAAVYRAFGAAAQLSVEAEGKSLAFDISDIGPGFAAIDACLTRHRPDNQGGDRPPAPSGGVSKRV